MNPRVQHKLGILFSSWEAHMLYGLVVSGPWNLAHYGWFYQKRGSCKAAEYVQWSNWLLNHLHLICSQGIYNLIWSIQTWGHTSTGTHTSLLIQRDSFSSHPARPSSRRQTCSVPQNAPHLHCTSASKSTIQELAACKLTLVANMNCTLLKRRRS